LEEAAAKLCSPLFKIMFLVENGLLEEAAAKWRTPLFKTMFLVENGEEILCIVYSTASNCKT
jgi:hypothetical protein